MALCFVQSIMTQGRGGEQNGRGMREGGLECVVERMTKTGKMSWGNRRD